MANAIQQAVVVVAGPPDPDQVTGKIALYLEGLEDAGSIDFGQMTESGTAMYLTVVDLGERLTAAEETIAAQALVIADLTDRIEALEAP